MSKTTDNERKVLFGNYGEKNGMYGNGELLSGNKNGR